MSQQAWKEQPFFVCGHRKTGTTLLVSLFDSHPQMCVFPDDSGFWYGYFPRFDSAQFSDAQKIQRLINVMFHQLRSGLGRLEAAKGVSFPFDEAEAEFRARMNGRSTLPSAMLMEAVAVFREMFLVAPEDQLVGWMEKTTSTEIYAADLFSWFPNAKVIHLLRDPRDNFASLKSGWEQRYRKYNDSTDRLLQSLLERGLTGMRMASLNQRRFGPSRYKVVRFEDLTAQPERTMRDLSEFLVVGFDETLLRPSFLGFPWKGNSFEGQSFDRPVETNVGRWRNRITEHEASVIEFYFERDMIEWGYDPVFSMERRMDAAKEHYKWFNFAQQFSSGGVADTFAPV